MIEMFTAFLAATPGSQLCAALTLMVSLFLVLLIMESTRDGIFRMFNRWVRHRNITAQGWPPAHVDADGDSVALYTAKLTADRQKAREEEEETP